MNHDYLPGNRVTLLESGKDYFPALLHALDAARQEIFLESYIFANDAIGQQMATALCAAAGRGVRVNVTVDGFGGRNFASDFIPRLTEAGVRALLYRPEIGTLHLRRHRLRRLHRKIVVIDGRIGFVGGINIRDDAGPLAGIFHYDYAVQVEGPVVAAMQRAARRMWEIVAWASFKRRFRVPHLPSPALSPFAGGKAARFLIRDNIRHRNDILHAYLEAIEGAREEIIIANAYFLPGLRFGRALQAAAERGVRISILLQGVTDHRLLHYATQTLYAAAVRSGIRIHEYDRGFLHAKVAVIDHEWATVGSSNIDPFSLLLAKEANIVVRDREFALQLRENLQHAISQGAREIVPEHIGKQSWHQTLVRWLCYGLVRAMVGIAGYGQKHWPRDVSV